MTTVTIDNTKYNIDVESAKKAGYLIPIKSFEHQLEQGDVYTFATGNIRTFNNLVNHGFIYLVVLQVLNSQSIRVLRVDCEGHPSRVETRTLNLKEPVNIVLLDVTKRGFSLKKD